MNWLKKKYYNKIIVYSKYLLCTPLAIIILYYVQNRKKNIITWIINNYYNMQIKKIVIFSTCILSRQREIKLIFLDTSKIFHFPDLTNWPKRGKEIIIIGVRSSSQSSRLHSKMHDDICVKTWQARTKYSIQLIPES